MREHLLGGEKAVEGGREPRVDRHLHQDLDDLAARQPDIEAGRDVHLELRRGVAERGQRCDGGDLPAAQVEARAGVDVAERKLDQVTGEIRFDVRQGGDHRLTGLPVDLRQGALSAVVAALVRF